MVRLPPGAQAAEVVHDGHMALRGEQNLVVVLAVDVHQPGPHFPEKAHRGGPGADPGGAAAVGMDVPGDHELAVFGVIAVFRQHPGHVRGNLPENRGNAGLLRPGADDLPGGPLAETGVYGVDEDGLARAGLAGENRKAPGEVHVGLFDHRKVFDI